MKVFVTGVAGFLGSHIAEWFVKNGHDVAGNDNMIGGDLTNIPDGVDFQWCDITNLNDMTEYMRGADVVYHCAAMAYEGVSVFAPATITNNITTGSATVFSAAIRNGVKRIVNCSSMARYGAAHAPFREDGETLAQDPYGIAKLAAERLLFNLADSHGFEAVVAVPHNIYGPRQCYTDPFRNVASIMVNLMLQKKRPVIYGDGSQIRCFSYISDCLSCLTQMADNPDVVGQVVNIGPDEGAITINELYAKLATIIGFDEPPIYMPGRPQEVFHATCSSEKARRLLGYNTTVLPDDGLKHLVDWIADKGPKPFFYDHLELEYTTTRTPRTWTDRLF